MKKKVAIIILNYNTWKETLDEISLCSTVLKIQYPDIIVVDNASSNDSAFRLQEESLKSKFVFLQSEKNKGYSAGNNIGLRYAYNKGYDYALILNNDILFDDAELIEKMTNIFSAKKPTFFDYTLGAFAYKNKGRIIDDLGGYAYIYRPQGCCMMVDLKKMDAIDYMDEHTFLYLEEPILAERLLKLNYKCALCTTSKIVHNHSATVNSVLDKKNRSHIVNSSFRYYLKEYRHFNSLQTNICIFMNYIKMMVE